MTAASSSQASQSFEHDLDELAGPLVAVRRRGCGRSPKLPAAAGSAVVTMFQPARPWLRKSSVASRRATSHG